MMKKAGVNCVTLGVFSWSVYEPAEGEFHFGWLEKIMDHLYENGIFTILATPSGAQPGWTRRILRPCASAGRGCAITTAYGITIV